MDREDLYMVLIIVGVFGAGIIYVAIVELLEVETNEIIYNCLKCFKKYGENSEFIRIIEVENK